MKKICSLIITLLAFATVAIAAEKPTAGLVLVGPKSDGGWSMRHYQGMVEWDMSLM